MLDALQRIESLLPLKSMFVVTSCTEYLQKCMGKSTDFLKSVRSAYLRSTRHLLTKLPLENPFISALSSLSPSQRGTSTALDSMKYLASCLNADHSVLALPEIHAYVSTTSDNNQVMEMRPKVRLYSYWYRVTAEMNSPNLWSVIKRA